MAGQSMENALSDPFGARSALTGVEGPHCRAVRLPRTLTFMYHVQPAGHATMASSSNAGRLCPAMRRRYGYVGMTDDP
jgi:hypothetical protein